MRRGHRTDFFARPLGENNVGTQATETEPSEWHGDTVRSVTHDNTVAAEQQVPEDDRQATSHKLNQC